MIDTIQWLIPRVTFLTMSILFIGYSALIDAEHINNRQHFKDHKSRWCLRFTYFLTILLVSFDFAFGFAFLFAATFDQVLNYMRGKPFWYLGTEAKWDLFWKRNMILYKSFKITALIISLYLFYGQYIHKFI